MKNQTILTLLSLAFASATIFSSCEEENQNTVNLQEGFSIAIQNFVPDSAMDKMRELGMIINEGKQPPQIEGAFFNSPNIMLSSSVPNERHDIGSRFIDYQYNFYNQDNQKLTIDLNTKGIWVEAITDESTGKGAFLSGYDNDFTAFMIQEGFVFEKNDTSYYKSLQVISGTITEEGIYNFHKAVWMLDDYGDIHDVLIPINSGRVFYDSDSLAINYFNAKSANLEPLKAVTLPSVLTE